MTDRVYPAAKPTPPPPGLNGAGPPKTTQLYNPNRPRPAYRPPQRRSRSCTCRRCCCLCFLYTLITLLVLVLVTAICACVFYVLYHPKHPTFAVSSIRLSKFNLTSPDPSGFAHINSRVDFTLTSKNPNSKKITFIYDPFVMSMASAGVQSGNATLPGFTHVAGNTTVFKVTVASDPTKDLDSDSVSQLRSDLGKKSGFPVTVELDTMVEVQMGKIKTKKVGVRVTCQGIKGFQPKDLPKPKPKNGTTKAAPVADTVAVGTTSEAKCKVDLRIKVWKFTF